MEKKYITWEEIEYLLWRAGPGVKDLPITSISGVPRGGVVPGVMLSHRTGIPWVQTPKVGSLVVDDIADSGETFLELERLLGYKPLTFTLYRRVSSAYTPTLWMREVPEGVWLVYPWESPDSRPIQDYKKS